MHALVLSGQILRERDFGAVSPPSLAPNKGAWLEIVDPGEPTHDPETEIVSVNLAIVEGVPTRVYTVDDRLPLALSWTPLEFIERFTEAEQLAIVTAAQGNPALRLFYDKLMASLDVRADEPRLIAGLDVLVSAGLLTAQRKSEILGE